MGKLNLKRNQVVSLLTALFIFAIILPGCKKQIDQTIETNIKSSSVVTIDQIKQWAASFLPTIVDQPTLLYVGTQKKKVNGREYLRVPTTGSGSYGGSFYFTKSDAGKLQALYVVTDQQTKVDGTVGFADFENQTYTLATYQNNKPVALYSLKDNKGFFEGVFTNKQTGSIRKQVDDACAEQTSIIKLPDGKDSIIIKKVNGGIECPGFLTIWQKIGRFFSNVGDALTNAFDWLFGWMGGGGGSGYSGGSFGSGGYGSWNFTDFWGLYGVGTGCTNCSSDPAGGGWGPYDPTLIPTQYDYYSGDGDDYGDADNIQDPNDPLMYFFTSWSSMYLPMGVQVQVSFGITPSDQKSAYNPVSVRLVAAIQFAVELAMKNGANITSIHISATTNGLHTANSNHYKALAVDISAINGEKIGNMSRSGSNFQNVIKLQQAFESSPFRRENFGPSLKLFNGQPVFVNGHEDHIHFGISAK